jgi:hypothetical protein
MKGPSRARSPAGRLATYVCGRASTRRRAPGARSEASTTGATVTDVTGEHQLWVELALRRRSLRENNTREP